MRGSGGLQRSANTLLRDVIKDAGVTYEALARSVRAVAGEAGDSVRTNRSAIAHWVAGATPSEPTARYLAEALSPAPQTGHSRRDRSRCLPFGAHAGVASGYADSAQRAGEGRLGHRAQACPHRHCILGCRAGCAWLRLVDADGRAFR